MISPVSEVHAHLNLLRHDVLAGTGADIVPWFYEGRSQAGDPPSVGPSLRDRWPSESIIAELTGFDTLVIDAFGKPSEHTGTPNSFLTACWELARAAMPSLPEVPCPARFLTERAALNGMSPTPPFSAGGSCRTLRARNGWWALSLPRPEDVELIAAIIRGPVRDHWRQLEQASKETTVEELVSLALDLGLAASAVDIEVLPGTVRPFQWQFMDSVGLNPSWELERGPLRGSWGSGSFEKVPRNHNSIARAVREGRRLRVLDLSGLWAGPLCGSLLARAGFDVVEVESPNRPDGARTGNRQFFDLINAHKRCVSLDFDQDHEELRALIEEADIIIEGSRPEALVSRGILAADTASRGG